MTGIGEVPAAAREMLILTGAGWAKAAIEAGRAAKEHLLAGRFDDAKEHLGQATAFNACAEKLLAVIKEL